MQLTPTISDQCMSTGPSFPSESVQTLFFDEAEGRARKIRSGDKLGEKWRR